MMTKTNHRIFGGCPGCPSFEETYPWPISWAGWASRADGHGHEYLEFSFGHLDYENWLVVWNMNFIFHNIWDIILPIDELIFFKMVIAPATRKWWPIFWPLGSQASYHRTPVGQVPTSMVQVSLKLERFQVVYRIPGLLIFRFIPNVTMLPNDSHISASRLKLHFSGFQKPRSQI